MTKNELVGIWNYFLSLETDLANTSRYIEPKGQEDVYSFEFAKLLILACTEVESVLKAICYSITGKQPTGDIGAYKKIVLENYPRITEASVTVARLSKNIVPFSEWNDGKLSWWNAYQQVKHNRGAFFEQATYRHAVTSIAALYILIFYLAKIENITFHDYESKYIDSDYCCGYLLISPSESLPGFEKQKTDKISIDNLQVSDIIKKIE